MNTYSANHDPSRLMYAYRQAGMGASDWESDWGHGTTRVADERSTLGWEDVYDTSGVEQAGMQAENGQQMIMQSRAEAAEAHDLQTRSEQNLLAADQLESNAREQESEANNLERQAASSRKGAERERARAAKLEQRAAEMRQRAEQLREQGRHDTDSGGRLVELGQNAQREGEKSAKDGKGWYFGLVDSDEVIESGERLRDQGVHTTQGGQMQQLKGAQENEEANRLELLAAQFELQADAARAAGEVRDERAEQLDSAVSTVRAHIERERTEARKLREEGEKGENRSRELLEQSRLDNENGQQELDAGYRNAYAALQKRQNAFLAQWGMPPMPLGWRMPRFTQPIANYRPVSWELPGSDAIYDRTGRAEGRRRGYFSFGELA